MNTHHTLWYFSTLSLNEGFQVNFINIFSPSPHETRPNLRTLHISNSDLLNPLVATRGLISLWISLLFLLWEHISLQRLVNWTSSGMTRGGLSHCIYKYIYKYVYRYTYTKHRHKKKSYLSNHNSLYVFLGWRSSGQSTDYCSVGRPHSWVYTNLITPLILHT